MSSQLHAPATLLPPGKEPLVPIVLEAGWAPEMEDMDKKKFLTLPGLKLRPSVIQPVASFFIIGGVGLRP
jgi:hypothetical protein